MRRARLLFVLAGHAASDEGWSTRRPTLRGARPEGWWHSSHSARRAGAQRARPADSPLPPTSMRRGVSTALSSTTSCAARAPVAFGLKRTVIVQLASLGSDAPPHVLAATEKSAALAPSMRTAPSVSVATPTLVTVTGVSTVWLTATLPGWTAAGTAAATGSVSTG